MLTHNYDYRSSLETSLRINWQIDDVIAGRTLDFTKPFLPEALAGVAGIRCLNEGEKLKLNQIRGFTYLYIFGVVEEYIVPSLVDHTGSALRGDEYEIRALLHFAEEESKHIQLFKWFASEFEKGFGTPCGVIGPVAEIADAILKHSKLGVFLTTLCIEWMTQRHYIESVKDNSREGLDPLFKSLLEHHWLEECQHAKIDTLVVDKTARELASELIESGVDDFMSIGKLLDAGLAAQIELDLVSLERAIGRKLDAAEKAEIVAAQTKAYRYTFLSSGISHPKFDRSLRELTPQGHSRVAQLASAIS